MLKSRSDLASHIAGNGAEIFQNACKLELEGIDSKRTDGRYRSGRNDSWIKATCRHRDTFAIVGWAEKNGKFDGVYLGRNDEGELAYGGKVERGFSEEDKKNLLAEHLIRCPACGRWIDMRDLGEVLEHERACDGTPVLTH